MWDTSKRRGEAMGSMFVSTFPVVFDYRPCSGEEDFSTDYALAGTWECGSFLLIVRSWMMTAHALRWLSPGFSCSSPSQNSLATVWEGGFTWAYGFCPGFCPGLLGSLGSVNQDLLWGRTLWPSRVEDFPLMADVKHWKGNTVRQGGEHGLIPRPCPPLLMAIADGTGNRGMGTWTKWWWTNSPWPQGMPEPSKAIEWLSLSLELPRIELLLCF